MKLDETITYPSLEGMSLCGSVPVQSACAQWLWWKSWIWSVHRSNLPQGVLATMTLVGSGAGAAVARDRARCEPGFSYAQWSSLPYERQGGIPKCWSRSPEGCVWADFISFNFVLSLPQRGAVLKQEGLERAPGLHRVIHWHGPSMPVRAQDSSQSADSMSTNLQKPPSSHSNAVQGLSWLCPI